MLAQNPIGAGEARAIAQEAYVFGLPLVYIGLNADVSTNVARPEGMRAPINQFANLREFPDALSNPIVAMNVDTLYSFANLDLGPEPIVLSVPQMEDRFWIMQIIDAWNDVPAAPGSRTVGGKGGNFAITGPRWKQTLPPGLMEIRSDTNLTLIGGRTYTAGKADYDSVHRIQDQYKLTPLSKWGTNYTPPASVPIKRGVDSKTPVPEQVFAMTPETFFNRLSELLVDNPARAADAPVIARMAKLGITPGGKFRNDSFAADVQSAIADGVAAGQQEIREGHSRMGQMINGWQIARDLGRYGTRYGYRATWTYYAVGGLLIEDAFYPTTSEDAEGNKLTGAHNYELRFAKSEIPPVTSFWSLTVYDADSYLVANPLNRYALGDRDNLKLGDDGSLTLYLQRESPGAAHESNWLPVPEGEIFLALRLYGPKQVVADGRWTPPPVKRVR